MSETFHGEERRGNDRRSDDVWRKTVDARIEENTLLTANLSRQIEDVSTKFNPLLQMKTDFDTHLRVICTWGKWIRRAVITLASIVTFVIPIIVGLVQMGFIRLG